MREKFIGHSISLFLRITRIAKLPVGPRGNFAILVIRRKSEIEWPINFSRIRRAEEWHEPGIGGGHDQQLCLEHSARGLVPGRWNLLFHPHTLSASTARQGHGG